MDDNEFSNLGDQIRGMVQQAIDSMDFGELSHNINDTANKALREAKKHMSEYEYKYRDEKAAQIPKKKPELPVISKSLPGKTAGILYTVFGGITLGVSLVMLVVVGVLSAVFHTASGIAGIIIAFLVILFGSSTVMLRVGASLRHRMKRLLAYADSLKGRSYCTIQELADKTGRNKKYVAKDLRRMIQLGMFREAYLDDKETCIILDTDTYNQYRQSQESYERREKTVTSPKKAGPEKQEPQTPYDEAVKIGENYIRQLREANDAIPGKAVSDKLSRLEYVVGRIFESVRRHPEQLDEMEKFMDYYLPTTVKLVNAYREFDSADIQGDNIKSAKKEIEQTLETINQAFERFYDDLYQDAAFDASADAVVLQTILEKDGWTNSDFKQEDKR